MHGRWWSLFNLIGSKVLGTKNFTSFAAPIISSIIAILLQYNRSMNFEEMLSSLKCYSLPDTKTFHYIKESLFTCDLLSAMNTNWLENKIFQNSKEVFTFRFWKKVSFLMNIRISL